MRALTTALLRFIAGASYRKGLRGLERLESFSVIIQRSVIASLVVGLAVYGVSLLSGPAMHFDFLDRAISTKLQMLAGALLVVQGFETSLGDRYNREVRVASMRNAQAPSGMLYIVCVILLMPVVQHMDLGGGGARLARQQPWPADGPGRLRRARRGRGPAGVGRRPAPHHHRRLPGVRRVRPPPDPGRAPLRPMGPPAAGEADGAREEPVRCACRSMVLAGIVLLSVAAG